MRNQFVSLFVTVIIQDTVLVKFQRRMNENDFILLLDISRKWIGKQFVAYPEKGEYLLKKPEKAIIIYLLKRSKTLDSKILQLDIFVFEEIAEEYLDL